MLPNSYIGDSNAGREAKDGSISSHFSFEDFKKEVPDVEIATNLGQPYSNSYCHLNPIYDFKPQNVEMLVMARLSFSLKKDKILNFMRNVAHRNCAGYQRFGQYKKREFPKFHKQVSISLEQTDATLQTQYPQVYKQHYQQSKSKNITDVFNIQCNEFGEILDIV